MKKIEKLGYKKEISGDNYKPIEIDTNLYDIIDKVNELIDRLNQEVSQPEEYAKEMNKSKEGVLESCAEAILNESQIKVENNTEEWDEKARKEMCKLNGWSESCYKRGSVKNDVVADSIREDLDNTQWFSINDVRQLLSERDRLLRKTRRYLQDYYEGWGTEKEEIDRFMELGGEVDRLLSSEK